MLQKIQLGWIDYSNEHRNKVMSVLQALATPEAIDELGIGLIRDGFADVFFPGTSTIQTRAKYFFIVPYILMELERGNIRDSKKFLKKLYSEEIALIPVLKEKGTEGVIGARAGKGLKRKPSSIYWSGLRTFEIFKYPLLSLDGYAKEFCKIKNHKDMLKSSGFEKEGMQEDDSDALSGEISSTFWRSLLPDEDWKEDISMELTAEEAKFLKDRILKAQATKDSLFAHILQKDGESIFDASYFESIHLNDLPDHIKADFKMATDFSEFIFGAIIRYNVILSDGKNEEANKKWQQWINSSYVQKELATFDYESIFSRLDITNIKLRHFIKEWKEVVLTNNEEAIDQVIIKREMSIKGKERAKLRNYKVYAYKDGDWYGGHTRLQYRFHDAKRIIADIYNGLEKA
ncbi:MULTISPECIES: DUF6361 family protein [Bacillus]|uniref:DUF6361 family protein n=1 Tax=Bacillus TaxID=1386 RepID=UPI0002D86FD8|nr:MULTISPECIES: DUF6361 family protein [Bacillus]